MSKKTIWIINQTAGTPDSGWGERHYFLAQKWKEKGYDTYIFSGSHNHLFTNQPKTNGKLTIEKIEEGITFCWVKHPKYSDAAFGKFWSNLVFTFRLYFLKLKTIPKPDFIVVSSMPIFPVVVGNAFKKRFKSKLLITEIRDLWPLTPIYLKGYSRNNPLVLFVSWFEKYAYKRSDKIVSLLPNAHKYINKISKDASKFRYIPNGINLNENDPISLPDEIISLIPKNKFIIGYAGTFGFANAMEYFIEASKLLKSNDKIHFIMVGGGVLLDDYKTQVDKDQDNISFIPKIPKNQVQHMLSFFDVCYLSRFDSKLYDYGVSYNKYFDYMLAKKPILESSNHINDQVEESGCGIIVPPENPEEIVKGILDLYELPKEYLEELGQKGYKFVKKYHTYDYLSNLYMKLFQ